MNRIKHTDSKVICDPNLNNSKDFDHLTNPLYLINRIRCFQTLHL